MKIQTTEDQLADFSRDVRILILSAMAVVVGVIGALLAKALVWLIAVFSNLAFFHRFSSEMVPPSQNSLGYGLIAVPVVGGLLIGLLARYGSEKIRGHGIPEALEAILVGRSRMSAKVALLKPLSSALSIGTGGPFGAEGPIIMTGGAFGSLFAQMFHLSSAERKTLLVAGAAAGMSAIFASPIAAVLLAVELLLFEWKPRSFIPVALASATAALMRVPLLGAGPLFAVLPHATMTAQQQGIAFLLGIAAGLASGLLTLLVYGFEDLFAKLPIHWMWWPALGGLAVGIAGHFQPRVLGVGYDVIDDLLHGRLLASAALALVVVKALAWSISLGSGTSGGVLAPLLIMGGALGAVLAPWLPSGDPALWSTLGMAAMMGGTMRSPLTGIVFALELTHDLGVLPGLLLACVAAHGVTVLLLRRSILTEKVARRGHHVAREYSVDPLDGYRVREVMDGDPPTITASTTLTEMSERIANHDAGLTRRQGTMVVDERGRLVGVITRGDLVRGLRENPLRTVAEAGSRDLIVTSPEETVRDALAKMLRNDVGRLPVVDPEDPHRLVGYLGRTNVLEARRRRIEEEEVRERGWSLPRPLTGEAPTGAAPTE